MVLHGVAVFAYPLSAREARLLNSIRLTFLLNITGAYYTTPTVALRIITGILPLPLKAEMEALLSPIAQDIQQILHNSTTITLAWIKAHDGTPGNEAAVILAKQIASKGQHIYIPIPRSYLKKRLGEISIKQWQIQLDAGETGRNIYQIQLKVQTTPIPWQRSKIHFATGHVLFPTHLHRFHLKSTDHCGSGEQGSPINCERSALASSYHLAKPTTDLIQL
ncbi:hypothetical protein AVEN_76763-1 [Araneus ventricosus]|uniref:RNase H type-1 domain-containing protein n=1 Tax=Araneus ventricosus TaxID=182803 RepID=A0A4Y2TE80_ARAVE|nr:hypothetical protein AVEN_76763-1 [Araneus ventricosus]